MSRLSRSPAGEVTLDGRVLAAGALVEVLVKSGPWLTVRVDVVDVAPTVALRLAGGWELAAVGFKDFPEVSFRLPLIAELRWADKRSEARGGR